MHAEAANGFPHGAQPVADAEISGYDRVIEAAIELFAAKGFHGTGIREVAEAAGMVSASLYHWFSNKEALLLAIMRRGQIRFNNCANAAVEPLRTPEARVAALVRVHVAVHARRRLEALVVDTEVRALGPGGREELLPLRDQYEHLWQQTLLDGTAAGTFSMTNPKLARLGLLQMCSGVSTWYREGSISGLQSICDDFARMALAMLWKPGRRRRALEDLEGPGVRHYIDLVEEFWKETVIAPPIGSGLHDQLHADGAAPTL